MTLCTHGSKTHTARTFSLEKKPFPWSISASPEVFTSPLTSACRLPPPSQLSSLPRSHQGHALLGVGSVQSVWTGWTTLLGEGAGEIRGKHEPVLPKQPGKNRKHTAGVCLLTRPSSSSLGTGLAKISLADGRAPCFRLHQAAGCLPTSRHRAWIQCCSPGASMLPGHGATCAKLSPCISKGPRCHKGCFGLPTPPVDLQLGACTQSPGDAPHGATHSGAFCTTWVRDLEAAGGQPGCKALACHNTEARAEAKRLCFGSALHNSGLQNRAELNRSLAGWGMLRQPWCRQELAAGCQVNAGSMPKAGSAPRARLLQLNKTKVTQKNRSPSYHSQPWSPTEQAAGSHPGFQGTALCFSAGEHSWLLPARFGHAAATASSRTEARWPQCTAAAHPCARSS